MSEMSERVAKALQAIEIDILGGAGKAVLSSSKAEEFARAAFAAMREPTAEMLYFGVGNQDALRTWNLMIAAALT